MTAKDDDRQGNDIVEDTKKAEGRVTFTMKTHRLTSHNYFSDPDDDDDDIPPVVARGTPGGQQTSAYRQTVGKTPSTDARTPPAVNRRPLYPLQYDEAHGDDTDDEEAPLNYVHPAPARPSPMNMTSLSITTPNNSVARHMSPAMSRFSADQSRLSQNMMTSMGTTTAQSQEYYENYTSIGNVRQRHRILATTERRQLNNGKVAVSKSVTSSVQSVEIQGGTPKLSIHGIPMDERKPAAINYDSADDEEGELAPIRLKNADELMLQDTHLSQHNQSQQRCLPLLKQDLVEKHVRYDDAIVARGSEDLQCSQYHPS